MNHHLSYPRWSAYPVLQAPALISSARALAKASAHAEVVAALEQFDNRLAYRTFLVGHDIGAADFVLWAAFKSKHPSRSVVNLWELTPSLSQPQGDRSFQGWSIPSPTQAFYIRRYPSHHSKCPRCSRSIKIQSKIVEQNRCFLRPRTSRRKGGRSGDTVPSRAEWIPPHRTYQSCNIEPVFRQDVQRKASHQVR